MRNGPCLPELEDGLGFVKCIENEMGGINVIPISLPLTRVGFRPCLSPRIETTQRALLGRVTRVFSQT